MLIRSAKMADVPAILQLVNGYAKDGLMLMKSPYQLYKAIQSFYVAEKDDKVVGCCRLNVIWKDLAEVSSLAVFDDYKRQGMGKALVQHVIEEGKKLGIYQFFTLTYQDAFFQSCDFQRVDRETLPHKVFGDCLMCPKMDNCDESAYIYNAI